MGVCFGGALGLFHCGVLVDGVEEIGDMIAVDIDVVDCILTGFIKNLVRDLDVGTE